jgi:hypothetical protein
MDCADPFPTSLRTLSREYGAEWARLSQLYRSDETHRRAAELMVAAKARLSLYPQALQRTSQLAQQVQHLLDNANSFGQKARLDHFSNQVIDVQAALARVDPVKLANEDVLGQAYCAWKGVEAYPEALEVSLILVNAPVYRIIDAHLTALADFMDRPQVTLWSGELSGLLAKLRAGLIAAMWGFFGCAPKDDRNDHLREPAGYDRRIEKDDDVALDAELDGLLAEATSVCELQAEVEAAALRTQERFVESANRLVAICDQAEPC